jgi:hypothetical protein
MDYHQFDMAFAAADGLASIERKVPVVTYTHSKAITRALCRLIWYPMNEEVKPPRYRLAWLHVSNADHHY